MKVLAISYSKNFFESGNIERQRMLECARGVDEYHIIVFSHESDGLESEVIEGKLYLHPTSSKGSFRKVLNALGKGRKLLKQGGEWVITAQDPFEAGIVGMLLGKLTRTPVNIQEHGDFYSTPHWKKESRFNALRQDFGELVLLKADTVRVVSERIKKTMIKLGVKSERLLTLSVSIDVNTFIEAEPNPSLIPGYDSSHKYILTVARFVSQKNLSLLIASFKRIANEFPKTKLLLVGTGPLEQELKQLADNHPQIVFMPWSNDVPALMKTTHVYALSSNYEGWGRVLIEAQAAGMPIITTDVGCVGEQVVAGESVEVVPVGDELQYAAGMERLLKRRHQAADVAREIARGLNPEKISYAKAWKEVLKKTLESKV